MAVISRRGRASVVGQDKGNGSLRPAARHFLRPLPAFSTGHHRSHSVTVTRSVQTTSRMTAAARTARRNPFGPLLQSLPRIANAALVVLIALATSVALGRLLHLRITLTDSSAPAGLYRLSIGAQAERGVLVAACLPEAIAREGLSRGDCPAGAEPVAKVVGALPGDLVTVEPDSVAINGVRLNDSRSASSDRAGRPLAHVAWGVHRVKAGEVWLFGFNDPRSWDSRYFGPVPLAAICGGLQPIVTW